MIIFFYLSLFILIPITGSVIKFDEYKHPYISARALLKRVYENRNREYKKKQKPKILKSLKDSFCPNKNPKIMDKFKPGASKLCKYIMYPKTDGQAWLALNHVLKQKELTKFANFQMFNEVVQRYQKKFEDTLIK